MTPMTDLIEAALELGYLVEAVSSRHIELVYSEAGHRTVITVESSNISAELLRSLLQPDRPAETAPDFGMQEFTRGVGPVKP